MARLADGGTLAARVVQIGASWQITLDDGSARRTVPAAELIEWGAPPDGDPPIVVTLVDGSRLAVKTLELDGRRLAAGSSLWGRLEVPRAAVAAIAFTAARPVPEDAEEKEAGQLLCLANGDRLRGEALEIRGGEIRFRAELGPVRVETSQVAVLRLRPVAPAATDGLRVWTGLADGSRLLASALRCDAEQVRITTAGREIAAPAENLVWLLPVGGRAVYLSDLAAAEYRHVPYLTLVRPYHRDRSAAGTPLACHGRRYAKGLGLPSTARLTYNLPADVLRFEAELGVDDDTAGGGSVRFRVFVDGRAAYAGPVVRGGEAPLPVAIDVAGAQRLDLVVDFAERADVQDHADWLGARLIRRP